MSKKVEVDVKLLIVAIALIIVATVGSAFATYLIFNKGDQTVTEKVTKDRKELGPIYDVGEFIINLNAANNQQRFIKTEIALELSDKRALADLEKRKPQVRDEFIRIFRSRTYEQLRNDAGMELLRMEMIKSMNALINKGEVHNVFFVDLIIQ